MHVDFAGVASRWHRTQAFASHCRSHILEHNVWLVLLALAKAIPITIPLLTPNSRRKAMPITIPLITPNSWHDVRSCSECVILVISSSDGSLNL